jgi:hypothetical protein
MKREKHMVLVRNPHTAKVCGVMPGAQGEVDAANPGVAIALQNGLLQPVREDGLALPSTDAGTVPAAEFRAAVAEIDRRGALLEAAHRELAELRAQVEALTAPKAPASDAKGPAGDEKPAKVQKAG